MGSVKNEPRGDAVFWQSALDYHLSPFYRKVELVEWGGVPGVLLTSKDREPYTYYVGVITRGRRLTVVEAFFPDGQALSAQLAGIREAIIALEVESS